MNYDQNPERPQIDCDHEDSSQFRWAVWSPLDSAGYRDLCRSFPTWREAMDWLIEHYYSEVCPRSTR